MSYKVPRAERAMILPINVIFRFLQTGSRVEVWLYENVNMRVEGHIVGFDEYMNLVLDKAEEHDLRNGRKRKLGRLLLRGQNVTLIRPTQEN